jgi:hypothetical protein
MDEVRRFPLPRCSHLGEIGGVAVLSALIALVSYFGVDSKNALVG